MKEGNHSRVRWFYHLTTRCPKGNGELRRETSEIFFILSSVVSPPHNPLPEGQRGVEKREKQNNIFNGLNH